MALGWSRVPLLHEDFPGARWLLSPCLAVPQHRLPPAPHRDTQLPARGHLQRRTCSYSLQLPPCSPSCQLRGQNPIFLNPSVRWESFPQAPTRVLCFKPHCRALISGPAPSLLTSVTFLPKVLFFFHFFFLFPSLKLFRIYWLHGRAPCPLARQEKPIAGSELAGLQLASVGKRHPDSSSNLPLLLFFNIIAPKQIR